MQTRSTYRSLEPPKETDTDVLPGGLTRTVTIRELEANNTACTTNSYTWNRPISEKSQRILETFKKRDKKRRTH